MAAENCRSHRGFASQATVGRRNLAGVSEFFDWSGQGRKPVLPGTGGHLPQIGLPAAISHCSRPRRRTNALPNIPRWGRPRKRVARQAKTASPVSLSFRPPPDRGQVRHSRPMVPCKMPAGCSRTAVRTSALPHWRFRESLCNDRAAHIGVNMCLASAYYT
jgi:hypothetical protein